MHIVLFQPQIPPNTGNIVRTCANTGSSLILVEPLGFDTSDKMLKRAGLDYWEMVNVTIISDLPSLLKKSDSNFYFFSSHAKSPYTEIKYQPNDFLIFGSETSGLPDEFRILWPDLFYTIPKVPNARCLNLSCAVSIVVYEAYRQKEFVFTA